MYPMSPTETEKFEQLIQEQKAGTEPTDAEILQKMIDEHDTTDMREGVAYYLNQNDILRKKQYYYKDGQRVEDTEGLKPNNRIPHNWHRILVDQKSSYIVGKPITFATEDEAFLAHVNDLTGEEFDDTMNELVKNASNKGVEYLHPFIDEDGNFDYMIFPGEQMIIIYEDEKRKAISYAIRYYPVQVNDKELLKAEIYTKTQVYYYIQTEDSGEFVWDAEEDENPASHFYYNEQGYGWGRVPIIPFRNNEEERNDLTFYKELIDEYDKTVSDNSNAFEELRRLIYVLKGYEGQDLGEFVQNLLYYGAINVDGEGGVSTLEPHIDMEASDAHLNRTEDDLWTMGQGVNPKSDKFGQNPSGVALRFLYSLLDLKANHVERKFRAALQQFMWFFTEYLSITNQGDYDPNSVSYTFHRTMIANESEQVKMAQESKGVISEQSIVEHHPWAAEDEMDRIQNEKDEYSQNLPSLSDGGVVSGS